MLTFPHVLSNGIVLTDLNHAREYLTYLDTVVYEVEGEAPTFLYLMTTVYSEVYALIKANRD